ncbi:hypothetical protein PO124_03120 [Bacillus licheniformis]|nr:hypothetical protein [Bacillus licheniformis]
MTSELSAQKRRGNSRDYCIYCYETELILIQMRH